MLTYLDSCTYVDFHQEIVLRKGWNYISFNIKPSFDSMVLSDSIKIVVNTIQLNLNW